MKQFEKVTQSVEALAEFLSTENKGDNTGCPGCANFEECTGKETCRKGWIDFLNSEAKQSAGDECVDGMEKIRKKVAGDITIEIGVEATQLDAAIEKTNQLVELLGKAQELIGSLSNGRPLEEYQTLSSRD